MFNPFDKGSVAFERYQSGYTVGKAHAETNLQALSSRKWPIAYRMGYSDGYFIGSRGLPRN